MKGIVWGAEAPGPTTLPAQRRFLVIDGRGLQAPGARGTHYRRQLGRELVTVTVVSSTIPEQRTGESLRHFPLGPGDVALADRGDGPPEAIRHTGPRGRGALALHPPMGLWSSATARRWTG